MSGYPHLSFAWIVLGYSFDNERLWLPEIGLFGLIVLCSQGVNWIGLKKLGERANITDAEVLEDIAEARTCEDCQVCHWQISLSGGYLSSIVQIVAMIGIRRIVHWNSNLPVVHHLSGITDRTVGSGIP
jgi:hypothetical protein